MIPQILPRALKARLAADDPKPLLLDVREPWEFAICHIEGSINLPMRVVAERLGEIATDRTIVVICHHGIRSASVADFLRRNQYPDILNLAGGIAAWADDVDPTMPRY